MNKINENFKMRYVGVYGNYIQPLADLVADLEEFLGLPLNHYLPEVASISRDEQGVHPEEAALLYLITRGIKPKIFLETGTFKGYSTSEIARAIKENNFGQMITVDLDFDTGSAVPVELLPYIKFYRGESSGVFAKRLHNSGEKLGIFFHDSLHTFMNTLGELINFSSAYESGCVIVCHDAKMDYLDDFGVGKAVRKFAKDLNIEYRILDTNCGLAVMKWPADISTEAIERLRDEYHLIEQRIANKGFFQRLIRRIKI